MNIKSEQEMYDFGYHFAHSPDFSRIIELVGDVGAGKTTFTRGLAAGLGATAAVTSPSFTISKSYALKDGRTLTHYDFYRLSDPGLMADDLHEKLADPRQILIIEWGTSVANLLPAAHTTIYFTKDNDGSREVTTESVAQSAGPQQSQRFARSAPIKQPQKYSARGLSEVTTENEGAKPVTTGLSDPSRGQTYSEIAHAVQLYLDTSSDTTILKLNDTAYEWHSGHELAEHLLGFIHDKLTEQGYDWPDLTEITFMSGPGSFTGLRIGTTVVNTLAHELHIPLKDHRGTAHQIILPDYGRPANITTPKK